MTVVKSKTPRWKTGSRWKGEPESRGVCESNGGASLKDGSRWKGEPQRRNVQLSKTVARPLNLRKKIGLGIIILVPLAAIATNQIQNHANEPQKQLSNGGNEKLSDLAKPANSSDNGLKDGKHESANQEFIKQELGDMASPFTRATVIKLNSIVARSLSAIQAFDETRETADRNNPTDMNRYRELKRISSTAKSDMSHASQQVRASGERYNEEILTAMIHFVENVDSEINDEIEQFSRVNSHH